MPGEERNYTIAYVGVALAVLYVRVAGQDDLAGILVALLGASACLWAATVPGPWSRERQLLLGALLGSFLGDAALNWTPYKALCIIPFTGVHLCLFALFRRLRPVHPHPLAALLPVLLVGGVFYRWHYAAMPGRAEAVVAACYLLLLAAMLWRALALLFAPRPPAARWLLPGALLYYATDHVVIFHQLHPSTRSLASIWIFYPMALYMLSKASSSLNNPPEAP